MCGMRDAPLQVRIYIALPQPKRSRLTSHAGTSTSTKLSTAFLGRARAIAAEHAQLSRQLAENYDVKTAKKIGELGATTTALSEWEKANTVRTPFYSFPCLY
jgi:peptide chain release factor 1